MSTDKPRKPGSRPAQRSRVTERRHLSHVEEAVRSVGLNETQVREVMKRYEEVADLPMLHAGEDDEYLVVPEYLPLGSSADRDRSVPEDAQIAARLIDVTVTVEALCGAGRYAVAIDELAAGQFMVRADGTITSADSCLVAVFGTACLEGVRSVDEARSRLQAEVEAGRARRPVTVRRDPRGSFWIVEIEQSDFQPISLSPYALDLLREDLDRLALPDDGWTG